MRTWSLDQFEFDDPASEEALDIAVAKRSTFPFPNVEAFVSSAVGVGASRRLPQPKAFDDHSGIGGLRTDVALYCAIEIPSPCNWPTYRIDEASCEVSFVVCTPDGFIYYRWHTSA